MAVNARFKDALAAHAAGDLVGAGEGYRRILAHEPDHAPSLHMLGLVEQKGRNYPLAEQLLRRVAAMANDAMVQHNLATLLAEIGDRAGAEAAYRAALEFNPKRANTLADLAYLLHHQGRHPEAETLYRRALEVAPDHARNQENFAHMLLRLGRWREAWPHFEYRLTSEDRHLFTRWPQWRGESLNGKTIIVSSEWGLGDTIQFARYVTLLRRAGAARVIFLAPANLHRLLAAVEGVDEVQEDELQAIEADYAVYLLSLPLHFDTTPETLATTLPMGLPVVRAPKPEGRDPSTRLRVGIFWAGGLRPDRPALTAIDARRSLDLSRFAPLMMSEALAGRVEWTLLQRDRRPQDLSKLAVAHGWIDPFAETNLSAPRDLYDTAVIIQGLDLVIGVDSALIHLSASLAKPTWMLDRADHCWRWTGAAATGWYPGALRIFRQPAPGDWDPVIGEAHEALLSEAGRTK